MYKRQKNRTTKAFAMKPDIWTTKELAMELDLKRNAIDRYVPILDVDEGYGDDVPVLKAYECIHTHRRDYCHECGGSQICRHHKFKALCKECDGSQLCVCGKAWHTCPICEPVLRCPHGRHCFHCKTCRKQDAAAMS